MFNIIKSQNYQIRHDLFSVIAMIIFAGITVYLSVCDNVTGGEKFVAMGSNSPMLWLIVCLVFGARIAAWDYNDKTINYELLAGHSRKEMFLGRFVSAFFWCIVICALIALIPLIVCSIRNGWGENVDFVNCMVRIMVSFLVMVRVLSEFFFLAVLLRNCYVTYAVSYILIGCSMVMVLIMSEMFGVELSCVLGYLAMSDMLELTNSHLEWINGGDISVYESALELTDTMKVIVSSVAVTLVCLLGGYRIFQKRDME